MRTSFLLPTLSTIVAASASAVLIAFGGAAPITLQLSRNDTMKRFLIEREIPGVGRFDGRQLKDASATSNAALAKLAGKVQWVQSYVTDDKTFCVYLADHEASVHEHAKLSGFPASKVTEIRTVIEPMTAA